MIQSKTFNKNIKTKTCKVLNITQFKIYFGVLDCLSRPVWEVIKNDSVKSCIVLCFNCSKVLNVS